jgi:hypothetical protein
VCLVLHPVLCCLGDLVWGMISRGWALVLDCFDTSDLAEVILLRMLKSFFMADVGIGIGVTLHGGPLGNLRRMKGLSVNSGKDIRCRETYLRDLGAT